MRVVAASHGASSGQGVGAEEVGGGHGAGRQGAGEDRGNITAGRLRCFHTPGALSLRFLAVCFAGDRTKPSNNGRNHDSGQC